MGDTMHQPGQLPTLAPTFDHVVIDCPGRNSSIQRSALAVADLAILPCDGTPPEVEALAESIEVVNAARERFPRLHGAILLARLDPRTAMGRNARSVIEAGQRELFGDRALPIFQSVLQRRAAYPELQASGMTIANYVPPGHAAIGEVAALVDEITQLLTKEIKANGEAETVVFRRQAAAGGVGR
jgi:chromosome partitioning protein